MKRNGVADEKASCKRPTCARRTSVKGKQNEQSSAEAEAERPEDGETKDPPELRSATKRPTSSTNNFNAFGRQ